MKKKDAHRNWKYYLETFVLVLGIILVFSFFDFLTHRLSESYSVPDRYFRNKIIFGTLIGFVTSLLIRKFKPLQKALIFSAAVAVLLQIRYFLEGYPLDFVLLFLGIHFVILVILSWIGFKSIRI